MKPSEQKIEIVINKKDGELRSELYHLNVSLLEGGWPFMISVENYNGTILCGAAFMHHAAGNLEYLPAFINVRPEKK